MSHMAHGHKRVVSFCGSEQRGSVLRYFYLSGCERLGAQGSPAIISAEDAAAPVGAGAAGGHSAICAVQHEAPPGEQPP